MNYIFLHMYYRLKVEVESYIPSYKRIMADTYNMIHISTHHYSKIGVFRFCFMFDGTNITMLHIVTS